MLCRSAPEAKITVAPREVAAARQPARAQRPTRKQSRRHTSQRCEARAQMCSGGLVAAWFGTRW
jgi:hypothetical protein